MKNQMDQPQYIQNEMRDFKKKQQEEYRKFLEMQILEQNRRKAESKREARGLNTNPHIVDNNQTNINRVFSAQYPYKREDQNYYIQEFQNKPIHSNLANYNGHNTNNYIRQDSNNISNRVAMSAYNSAIDRTFSNNFHYENPNNPNISPYIGNESIPIQSESKIPSHNPQLTRVQLNEGLTLKQEKERKQEEEKKKKLEYQMELKKQIEEDRKRKLDEKKRRKEEDFMYEQYFFQEQKNKSKGNIQKQKSEELQITGSNNIYNLQNPGEDSRRVNTRMHVNNVPEQNVVAFDPNFQQVSNPHENIRNSLQREIEIHNNNYIPPGRFNNNNIPRVSNNANIDMIPSNRPLNQLDIIQKQIYMNPPENQYYASNIQLPQERPKVPYYNTNINPMPNQEDLIEQKLQDFFSDQQRIIEDYKTKIDKISNSLSSSNMIDLDRTKVLMNQEKQITMNKIRNEQVRMKDYLGFYPLEEKDEREIESHLNNMLFENINTMEQSMKRRPNSNYTRHVQGNNQGSNRLTDSHLRKINYKSKYELDQSTNKSKDNRNPIKPKVLESTDEEILFKESLQGFSKFVKVDMKQLNEKLLFETWREQNEALNRNPRQAKQIQNEASQIVNDTIKSNVSLNKEVVQSRGNPKNSENSKFVNFNDTIKKENQQYKVVLNSNPVRDQLEEELFDLQLDQDIKPIEKSKTIVSQFSKKELFKYQPDANLDKYDKIINDSQFPINNNHSASDPNDMINIKNDNSILSEENIHRRPETNENLKQDQDSQEEEDYQDFDDDVPEVNVNENINHDDYKEIREVEKIQTKANFFENSDDEIRPIQKEIHIVQPEILSPKEPNLLYRDVTENNVEVINSLFEKYKNDQTLQINPRESTIEELESEYKQSIQSDFHKKTPPRVFKSGYNPVSVSNNEESILNDLSKFRQFAMNEINQSQLSAIKNKEVNILNDSEADKYTVNRKLSETENDFDIGEQNTNIFHSNRYGI